MTETANLALPFIEAAQAQKHVIHNETLRILDALVMLAVKDRDLSSPPGFPAEGDRYIVKAPGSGAFASKDNQVAHFADGGWSFYPPRLGWTCYVQDEGALLAWDGDFWEPAIDLLGGVSELQNLSLLGIATTADNTNPFSAKLNNALWTARTVAEGGDGALRYKLSKESAAKTLSFLFQDNFSGRAEIGLTGDDDFHFKVSADGTAWLEAIVIDRTTGEVAFPHTDVGGPRLIPSNNLSDLASKKAGYDNINIHGADVTSAATVDLDAATGVLVDITGATTITAITLAEGRERVVRFTGALTLTHGAALVLPNSQSLATQVGDFAVFRGYGAGVVRLVSYFRASGHPLTTAETTVASAATVDLGAARGHSYTITGATTITSFGSTAPTGTIKYVLFSGALTLTHNATSLILPGGANILTAAGDTLTARHEGAGNWRVLRFSRAWRIPFPDAAEEIGELIQACTEDTAPVPSTDMLGTYDASADTGKKITVERMATLARGLPGTYPSGPYHGGEAVNPGSTGAFTLVANTLYTIPFYVGKPITITELSIDVTTAVASTNARLGVLSSAATTGLPGDTVLLDAGTVATATTGIKAIGSLSLALEIGYYYLVVVSDGAPAIRATANPAGGSHIQAAHLGAVTPGTTDVRLTKAFTYGVLSGAVPFGAPTRGTGLNVPNVYFRV